MTRYSLLSILFISSYHVLVTSSKLTFKAASYELEPYTLPKCNDVYCTREEAVGMMMKNVDVIKRTNRIAAMEGADIIVYPEYGIVGNLRSRSHTKPFMQEIPLDSCKKTQKEETRDDIMQELSKAAAEAAIYMVVNLVTADSCSLVTDPSCTDGWFIYNSNVVFSDQGEIVAVYHKYNLYDLESQTYDRTPRPEAVTFDTHFGRIGLLICFDILFEEPGMSVLKKGAQTVAYPTFWYSEPPFLTGVQTHSSWAYRNAVNVIAAQAGTGEETGSGIYSTHGVHALYFNGTGSSKTRLLIAELPIVPDSQVEVEYGKFANSSTTPESADTFMSEFDYDLFNFTLLEDSGTAKVCYGNFCCEGVYKKHFPITEELYAIGAYSGIQHTETFHMEVCGIIKCGSLDRLSCGSTVWEARQIFHTMKLSATFSTNMVYPSLFLDGLKSKELPYNRFEVRQDGVFQYEWQPQDKAVISAQLFGRPFFKDPKL